MTTLAQQLRQEGRLEGQLEGKEEGREEGREEGILGIAENMLQAGMPTEQIMSLTSISEQGINKLAKKLNIKQTPTLH